MLDIGRDVSSLSVWINSRWLACGAVAHLPTSSKVSLAVRSFVPDPWRALGWICQSAPFLLSSHHARVLSWGLFILLPAFHPFLMWGMEIIFVLAFTALKTSESCDILLQSFLSEYQTLCNAKPLATLWWAKQPTRHQLWTGCLSSQFLFVLIILKHKNRRKSPKRNNRPTERRVLSWHQWKPDSLSRRHFVCPVQTTANQGYTLRHLHSPPIPHGLFNSFHVIPGWRQCAWMEIYRTPEDSLCSASLLSEQFTV